MARKKTQIVDVFYISPLAIYADAEERIARINPDGSWSVQWDEVAEVHYSPLTENTRVVKGFCNLLMAAKDNFRPTPWFPIPKWDHSGIGIRKIGYCYSGQYDVVLQHDGRLAAGICRDGNWSVNWPYVNRLYRDGMLTTNDPGHIAMIGLVDLLLAAKDNFVTNPWAPSDE